MTLDATRVGEVEVRWTPAEVYSIQASGLRDLADEHALAGDRELAREFEQLAAPAEAALTVELEAGR